jgi:hypothetical protein
MTEWMSEVEAECLFSWLAASANWHHEQGNLATELRLMGLIAKLSWYTSTSSLSRARDDPAAVRAGVALAADKPSLRHPHSAGDR